MVVKLNAQIESKVKEKLDEIESSKQQIIDREDPAVVEGFSRLRRLCQIKTKRHDQIENLIFGKSYKPEAKTKLPKLEKMLS